MSNINELISIPILDKKYHIMYLVVTIDGTINRSFTTIQSAKCTYNKQKGDYIVSMAYNKSTPLSVLDWNVA